MGIRRSFAALTLGLCGVLAATSTASAGVALTKPHAQAIVAAGVIQQKDLPEGFFSPPRTAAEPDRKAEAEFYDCLGTAQPRYRARNIGSKFLTADKLGQDGAWTLEVDSAADVTKTLAAAKADQAALRTSKAVSCYRERLIAGITTNLRAQPKSVTVELVPATLAGADEAWAYQLSWTVSRDDKEVSGNGYLFGSRVGQALLKLFYTGTGKQYTLDEVTKLAAKPLARAKQAAAAKAKPRKKA